MLLKESYSKRRTLRHTTPTLHFIDIILYRRETYFSLSDQSNATGTITSWWPLQQTRSFVSSSISLPLSLSLASLPSLPVSCFTNCGNFVLGLELISCCICCVFPSFQSPWYLHNFSTTLQEKNVIIQIPQTQSIGKKTKQ